MAARQAHNLEAGGSSPPSATIAGPGAARLPVAPGPGGFHQCTSKRGVVHVLRGLVVVDPMTSWRYQPVVAVCGARLHEIQRAGAGGQDPGGKRCLSCRRMVMRLAEEWGGEDAGDNPETLHQPEERP